MSPSSSSSSASTHKLPELSPLILSSSEEEEEEEGDAQSHGMVASASLSSPCGTSLALSRVNLVEFVEDKAAGSALDLAFCNAGQLNGQTFSDTCDAVLQSAISVTLEEIDLSGNHLTAKELPDVLRLIAGCPCLTTLRLTHNRFDVLDGRAMVRALASEAAHADDDNDSVQTTSLSLLSLDSASSYASGGSLKPVSTALTHLDMSDNALHTLRKGLGAALPNLKELLLCNNNLAVLSDVKRLGSLARLEVLDLRGNKFCHLPTYRPYIVHHVPFVQRLDGEEVTLEERQQSGAIANSVPSPRQVLQMSPRRSRRPMPVLQHGMTQPVLLHPLSPLSAPAPHHHRTLSVESDETEAAPSGGDRARMRFQLRRRLRELEEALEESKAEIEDRDLLISMQEKSLARLKTQLQGSPRPSPYASAYETPGRPPRVPAEPVPDVSVLALCRSTYDELRPQVDQMNQQQRQARRQELQDARAVLLANLAELEQPIADVTARLDAVRQRMQGGEEGVVGASPLNSGLQLLTRERELQDEHRSLERRLTTDALELLRTELELVLLREPAVVAAAPRGSIVASVFRLVGKWPSRLVLMLYAGALLRTVSQPGHQTALWVRRAMLLYCSWQLYRAYCEAFH